MLLNHAVVDLNSPDSFALKDSFQLLITFPLAVVAAVVVEVAGTLGCRRLDLVDTLGLDLGQGL